MRAHNGSNALVFSKRVQRGAPCVLYAFLGAICERSLTRLRGMAHKSFSVTPLLHSLKTSCVTLWHCTTPLTVNHSLFLQDSSVSPNGSVTKRFLEEEALRSQELLQKLEGHIQSMEQENANTVCKYLGKDSSPQNDHWVRSTLTCTCRDIYRSCRHFYLRGRMGFGS